MAKKAQGSLEYLIIIAAVLAVSAIIILFLTSAFQQAESSATIGNCKESASRCKTELVTSINPACGYCYDYCVKKDQTEIFPGAYQLCLGGHPEQIFDGALDIQAPVIKDLRQADLTSGGITIEWKTDEPADTLVYYGLNPAEVLEAGNEQYVSDLSFDHQIILTGLDAGTQYFYEAWSTDGSNNSGYGGMLEFTTLP